MNLKNRLFLIPVLLFLSGHLLMGQQGIIIYGTIKDYNNKPLPYATVVQENTNNGAISKADGSYEIWIPELDRKTTLIFSYTGLNRDTFWINPAISGTTEYNPKLQPSKIKEVIVVEREEKGPTLKAVDPLKIGTYVDITGIDALKTLPGFYSRNEFSSQFSVRGGNFDENLIFINDIEIYRPMLIKSGQQEGMSFINSDMVSSIKYSTGGFEAKYGDKMSSVLDISYKKPRRFGAGVSGSLLGGKVFLQGRSKDKKFTHVSGLRYKTSKYFLGGLDTKGEYNPSNFDFQTYLTYGLTEKLEISFLGNYSQNKYDFIPVDRSTEFGTFQTALNLKVFYDGKELDKFNTTLGAVTLNYKPRDSISLKFIVSGISSIEEETYDIRGQYLINELDRNTASSSFGDSLINIGVGTFQRHARNYLNAYVISAQHIGTKLERNHAWKWGVNLQNEIINDQIEEWKMMDSAGYTLPYSSSEVNFYDNQLSGNTLNTYRVKAFLQKSYKFNGRSEKYLTLGGRSTFWTYNTRFTLDPRAYFGIKPDWKKDMLLSLALGHYSQPPFYKEMRRPDGTLNDDIKAQKSIHLVLGSDYNFFAFSRLFKFTAELYGKYMYDLIPYTVDNVRIEYLGENNAVGYATGLDLQLHGEFVRDAESWMSMSFMSTQEDQKNDFYINDNGEKQEIGYYSRPTDQIMNFGLFFQDYLPNNPSYKVHLTFIYGSALPLNIPNSERYDVQFEIPPYRRVDIGFSKIFKMYGEMKDNFLDHFNTAWLSVEIFNLLDVDNTISYLWLKTVSNSESVPGMFAVPNYLTSRRYNVRLTVKF